MCVINLNATCGFLLQNGYRRDCNNNTYNENILLFNIFLCEFKFTQFNSTLRFSICEYRYSNLKGSDVENY